MSEIESLVLTCDPQKALALRRHEAEVKKIKDVQSRYKLLSHYYSLIRNENLYKESINNLRHNNFEYDADLIEYQSAVVNGYGEKIGYFANIFVKKKYAVPWVEIFKGMFLTGQFALLNNIYDEVRKYQLLKDPEHSMPLIVKGIALSKQLKISKEVAAKRYSLFGEVLRSEGLYWATDWKAVKLNDVDHGGPQILLQYQMYLDPLEAARLNLKISKAFAENDVVVPGVSFRIRPGIEMSEQEQMDALNG